MRGSLRGYLRRVLRSLVTHSLLHDQQQDWFDCGTIAWQAIKLLGRWNKQRDEEENWLDCSTSSITSNKLQYLYLSRTNFIASHAGRSVWRVSGGATLSVVFLTRCYTNPNSLLAPVSLFLQSAFSWEASFQLFGKPTEFTLQTKKRNQLTIS